MWGISVRKVCLCLLILVLSGCASRIPERPESVSTKKLHIEIREPQRYVLPNGLIVYYLYNNELPLMKGTMLVPGGSLYDSKEQAGLSATVGSQLRSGGTRQYRPEDLDRQLDSLGASIEASYAEDFGSISFQCLSADFPQVVELYRQVVMEPRFDEERLALWKRLAADSIRRRRDDPETMAAMLFSRIIYGDSPYSLEPTSASIARITVQDLVDYHRRFVNPRGARLAISGSVPWSEVKTLIDRAFASWPAATKENFELPSLEKQARPGIYLLKRDFTQAQIIMGHLGPPRITDDLHAQAIFNTAFGIGGFGSVLFRQVRSQAGLAYAVFGGIFGGPTAGSFQVQMATRNEEAINAIDKVLGIVRTSWGKPVSDNSIAETKRSLKQGFVFKFETPNECVQRKALLEQLGYPVDFDRTYLDKIDGVSRDETAEVSKRWIRPNEMSIVIVGNIDVQELKRHYEGIFPVYETSFDEVPVVPKIAAAAWN